MYCNYVTLDLECRTWCCISNEASITFYRQWKIN